MGKKEQYKKSMETYHKKWKEALIKIDEEKKFSEYLSIELAKAKYCIKLNLDYILR